MSKIKHITVTTTEQEIALGATYQFAWFRNNSDVDVIVSDHSGIVEDADDTEIIKSNDVGRITITNRDKVYAKAVSDTAKIDVHVQNFEGCPFKSGAKGGGSGSGANIYRTTTALTDGATTNPITVDGESVTAVSGDFAVYNTQEFLFDGTQWNLLGDRVGLGELAYLDQDDLGELAMKDADDIHREISDVEYEALTTEQKNDGTEYFVYETSEDNRTVTAYDSNGNFMYTLSMYGCAAIGGIDLGSKVTTPPTITGPDVFGSGSFILKGTFADGNTYYFSSTFTDGRSGFSISNDSSRVSDAYGTNLFFVINGNRFNLMSAPNVEWRSSIHISGYDESSFEYGAVETGKRYIKAYDKSYGDVTIDPTPTQGSSNAVSSGGVYTALQNVSPINYSTTEQATGRKWIDGKPIYRKTYVKTAMGEYPNELPANLETMVNVESALKYTGEATIITPIYATGSNDYFGAYFNNNTLVLRDTHTTGATGITIIISIYYTKTTDTAE